MGPHGAKRDAGISATVFAPGCASLYPGCGCHACRGEIRGTYFPELVLPTIAYFLGISVRMFFNDHDPPHFHVRYQGHKARVSIATGEIIDGRVPPAVARILREWTELRRDALMRNWVAARAEGQLERIAGLE